MTGYPILFFLLDGLGDWPCRELGGATPLEAAHTPALDAVAARGANGIVYPLGAGRCPSSERAQWAFLGYRPERFPGRAALEAEGAGLHVPLGTVCAYAALRSARPEGGYLRLQGRYREAEEEDASELLAAVDRLAFHGILFHIRPIERGDALLTLGGCGSAEVTDSDPFSTDRPVLLVEAREEAADPAAAERTATALNRYLLQSHRVLDQHPVNRRRRQEGSLPLNVLVTKWIGRRVPVEPLNGHVGGPAAIVSSVPMYRGLAVVVAADYHHVPESDPESEVTAKVEQALELMKDGHAFVYVHTKAPDEAAHRGDPVEKMRVIEGIDRAMAPLIEEAGEFVLAVTADHTTPTWGPLLHSGDAVPLAVAAPSARVDDVERFGERAAARGSLGTLRGEDLLPVLVNLSGRGRFLGSRHGRISTAATSTDLPLLSVDGSPAQSGLRGVTMDLHDRSDHLNAIHEKIDRLYEETVRPLEERLAHRFQDSRLYLDEQGRRHPEISEARREIMRAAGKAGIYSLHLPEEIGGGGLGRADMLEVEEHVYRYGVGLNPAILSWSEGAAPRVIFSRPEQWEEYVDPLVRGECTSIHGVTEPQAGSNFFDFRADAVRRDGKWILNGHKAFITNAFEADIAQVLVVTDPNERRRRFTYFQFRTKEFLGRGFRPGRVYQTMFDDGLTGEFFMEDLELSDEHMLGERGQGFEIAMTSISWTRMRRGGMCAGWGAYLIDRSLERARTREIGGRPLGSRQGIQWMIADMYLDWYQARALSLSCARELDDPGPWWEARSPEDIRRVCLVKLSNDEAFYRIADRAVQIHGGAGMMKASPVNKLFLIARNLRVPGGSDEIQRTTIAETLGLKFRG